MSNNNIYINNENNNDENENNEENEEENNNEDTEEKNKKKDKKLNSKTNKKYKTAKDNIKKNSNKINNNYNYSNKISDELLNNFKAYLKKNIRYKNAINNFMLDDVIKIIDIPTESISCFDDNGLSFIQAYYDKINIKINNNLNNNIKKYFINELKKKRDSLHNNLKNVNKIIKELIDFKNFLKVENLLNNSQKKSLTFLNSKSTLFIKDPYIVGECIAHFLFLTIQNKYNLSNDDFYVSNLFNDDNKLTSFTDLNDIIKYFLFYYNIIDSFAAKDSDYSILFNETKRKEVIKKCVFITPYVKTDINHSSQKTTQKSTQHSSKKKHGGRDEEGNLLSQELKKTVNKVKSSTQKSETSETTSNSNNLLQKLKKVIIESPNKNLYEVYNKNFKEKMINCYKNYYSNSTKITNKNNIENLFQKDNEEIPIINILNNSYIATLKKNVNKPKPAEQINALYKSLASKSGGVKKSKGKSGTKNTSYENIKLKIKNTQINTIIDNIDYHTKFTFLQSIHYLNDEKNRAEINIFLKKLKTNLIDILLLFYINKKEIIKTFLNEFSNRKLVLNKNINIKTNNIKNNNIVNNGKKSNEKENNDKEKNTKKKSNKNKKINTKINTMKIDQQIKLYNLKNPLQIKKVKLLLTKLEEIKNLEGTPDYDKMVIIIEKKIRDVLLNKK